MAKKVIQMYDKYHSTTKVYPKLCPECFEDNIVDDIVEKSGLVEVEANPTLAGTEATLEAIKIGETSYKLSITTANPTLAGTEGTLESIEINGTKFKVGVGGAKKYMHILSVRMTGSYGYTISFVTSDNTPITADTWETYWAQHTELLSKNFICSGFSSGKPISRFQVIQEEGYYKQGIWTDSSTSAKWGWNAGGFESDYVFEI